MAADTGASPLANLSETGASPLCVVAPECQFEVELGWKIGAYRVDSSLVFVLTFESLRNNLLISMVYPLTSSWQPQLLRDSCR